MYVFSQCISKSMVLNVLQPQFNNNILPTSQRVCLCACVPVCLRKWFLPTCPPSCKLLSLPAHLLTIGLREWRFPLSYDGFYYLASLCACPHYCHYDCCSKCIDYVRRSTIVGHYCLKKHTTPWTEKAKWEPVAYMLHSPNEARFPYKCLHSQSYFSVRRRNTTFYHLNC